MEAPYWKTSSISVISVNVSATAIQSWGILICFLDKMKFTHMVHWWIHPIPYKNYMRVIVVLLMDLPTFSLFRPANQKHGKDWCFQQSFSLRFGFYSKLNFEVNIRVRARTHRNTWIVKTKFTWNVNVSKIACKVSHRSDCTFFGCILLTTLTNHRSKSPYASRLHGGITYCALGVY